MKNKVKTNEIIASKDNMSVIETDEGLKVVERIKVIEKVKRVEPKGTKEPKSHAFIRIVGKLVGIAIIPAAFFVLITGALIIFASPFFIAECDMYSYVDSYLEEYPEIKPVVIEALEDKKLTKYEWYKIEAAAHEASVNRQIKEIIEK